MHNKRISNRDFFRTFRNIYPSIIQKIYICTFRNFNHSICQSIFIIIILVNICRIPNSFCIGEHVCHFVRSNIISWTELTIDQCKPSVINCYLRSVFIYNTCRIRKCISCILFLHLISQTEI